MPASTLVRPVIPLLRPLNPASVGCIAILTTRLQNIRTGVLLCVRLASEPAEERRIADHHRLQNSQLNYDCGAMNLHLVL
jgi:hypothetical protein